MSNKKITDYLDELKSLRAFAKDLFEATDWPDGGDLDMFDFQELAVKHGLLKGEYRTEPCGENCQCGDNYSSEAFRQGKVLCYRKVDWLNE